MGRILSSYRQLNGLSQSDLAQRLNLHQASISRLENGETNRVLDLVFRILSLLDLENSSPATAKNIRKRYCGYV